MNKENNTNNIFKQWWFWVLFVIIFLGIIVLFGKSTHKNNSSQKSTSKSYTKTATTKTSNNKKTNKDLISFDKNIIKTPKGTIEILKEATGKTTDGKDGIALMYRITNNSDEALTPKQILKGNQISVYENDSKSDKPAENFFGVSDFQDLNDLSDSAMSISDAINKDNDNWDKTKIAPHQSIVMSDGNLEKVDNANNAELKVTDSINNVDGNVINKHKDNYKISNPVEKIDITKWNG